MKSSIVVSACSNKGNRENNEDNLCVNGAYMQLNEMDLGYCVTKTVSLPVQLYAVCDGMGGQECGETASFYAVSGLSEMYASINPKRDMRRQINATVAQINERIVRITANKSAGSTLALVVIYDGEATIAYLGDSRIYLCRDGQLFRLTRDHSAAQRLLNLGILQENAMETHPTRHILTQYLGMNLGENTLAPSYGEDVQLKKDDHILLCSDGLTDMVSEEAILRILAQPGDRDSAQKLIGMALSHGGADNVTAIALRIFNPRMLI